MILHALFIMGIFVASLSRLAHRDTLSLNQRIGMILMAGGSIGSFVSYCNTSQFHYWAEQAILLGVVLVAAEGAWRIDARRRFEDKRAQSIPQGVGARQKEKAA